MRLNFELYKLVEIRLQSKLYWYAYIEDNNFAAVEHKVIAGVSVQKRAKAVFGGHSRNDNSRFNNCVFFCFFFVSISTPFCSVGFTIVRHASPPTA